MTMAKPSSTIARPVLLAAILAALLATVSAHAFMSYPASRGTLSGSGGVFHYDTVDMSCPVDYCPECQNGAFLQNNHGSLVFAPYAPMDRTQPFRTGFGMCGDSGLDGRDPMKQPHMKAGAFSAGCEGKPTATGITPGQILNIQIQSVAHHQGFLEFFICDTAACGGDITPECFKDNHCVQLLRVPHSSCETGEDMECAPIDPNFPGRWYMPCHAYPYLNTDTSQMVQDQTMGGPNGKMAYQVPSDFNCGKNCVLQSYWVTMNKCNPIGSAEYFKNLYSKGMLKAWNMCAGDGITRGGFSALYHLCGSSPDLFPEEFWNCADITMSGSPFNSHNYTQYTIPGNNGAGAGGTTPKSVISSTPATFAVTSTVSKVQTLPASSNAQTLPASSNGSGASTSGSNGSGANTSGSNGSGANTSGSNGSGANTSGSNGSGGEGASKGYSPSASAAPAIASAPAAYQATSGSGPTGAPGASGGQGFAPQPAASNAVTTASPNASPAPRPVVYSAASSPDSNPVPNSAKAPATSSYSASSSPTKDDAATPTNSYHKEALAMHTGPHGRWNASSQELGGHRNGTNWANDKADCKNRLLGSVQEYRHSGYPSAYHRAGALSMASTGPNSSTSAGPVPSAAPEYEEAQDASSSYSDSGENSESDTE